MVWSEDPNQPISNVQTLDEIVAHGTEARRMRTILMTAFAGLALFLAAVGLYGVLSRSVAERTAGIGVRIALGDQPRRIQMRFIRHGLALTLTGLILGGATAFAGAGFRRTCCLVCNPTTYERSSLSRRSCLSLHPRGISAGPPGEPHRRNRGATAVELSTGLPRRVALEWHVRGSDAGLGHRKSDAKP